MSRRNRRLQPRALACYREALRLRPDLAQARDNRARLSRR
jgi:hypothetical protein